MGPANESRMVLIGTAIAIVVLLLFALSLGAVLFVSWMTTPGSVVPPSPVTPLAPGPSAAQTDEPDSTQVQVTPTSPAATTTSSDPTSEPNTHLSTHMTRPVPPTATAPPPAVPIATLEQVQLVRHGTSFQAP